MKLLVLKDQRQYSNSKEDGINPDGSKIEFKVVAEKCLVVESSEMLKSTSRYCRRSSRVSARAIARANYFTFPEVKPTDLAFMNRSTVIPTWGWRCKGLNLAILSFAIKSRHAQGVLGVDLFDLMPSNFMPTKWVNYHDSFVVKDDRGMQEDLISNSRSEKAPNGADHTAGKSIVKKINIGKAKEKKETQISEYVRALRSEEFTISHEQIFSCKSEKRVA